MNTLKPFLHDAHLAKMGNAEQGDFLMHPKSTPAVLTSRIKGGLHLDMDKGTRSGALRTKAEELSRPLGVVFFLSFLLVQVSFLLSLKRVTDLNRGPCGKVEPQLSLSASFSPTPCQPASVLHTQLNIFKKRTCHLLCYPIAQPAKNPPAMQETLIRFLGQEDPLEKGSHPSILAWRIPWAV